MRNHPPFSSTRGFINPFGSLNYGGTASKLIRNEASIKRAMGQTTDSRLFLSRYVNSGNVTNSHNKTLAMNNSTITVNKRDDENSQIKQWLSPLEPRQRHRSVQSTRADGVGGWLLERNEFRAWSGSHGEQKQAVLFCYGDPGVGKTHIRFVKKLSNNWM